jgi:hypothetical protein
MTVSELFNWLKQHGCEIKPLDEHKAKVIWFTNPKNGKNAYLGLPPREPLGDYTVFMICINLVIPLPEFVAYLKGSEKKIGL